jgi:hypothetical protein
VGEIVDGQLDAFVGRSDKRSFYWSDKDVKVRRHLLMKERDFNQENL